MTHSSITDKAIHVISGKKEKKKFNLKYEKLSFPLLVYMYLFEK